FGGALLPDALFNLDKLRITRANHPFRIDITVHINRDPAAVHEREIRVPDQPDMVRPESLDKKLLRVPSKTEHFAVTRPELLLVDGRRLICALHVGLVRCARTCPRSRFFCGGFFLVYRRGLSATLNVRLSTYVCARFWFGLLPGTRLLPFRWRSRLRLTRLPLRLLWLRCLA